MNLRRRKFLAVMDDAVERGEVATLATMHTFSCRLCGLRSYEETLKDELAGGGR